MVTETTGRRRPGRGKYDRSKSREERRADQRRHLLDVAAEVFATMGYSDASVTAIVERAGVSRHTYYAHFADLREALVAVYEDATSRFFDQVVGALRSIDDPIDRLRVGIAGYLRNLASNAALAIVLYREITALGAAELHRRAAVWDRYAAFINEGVAEAYGRGQLSRRPDELTAYALVRAMEGVAMRYIERGDGDRILEAAPVLVELFLRAYGYTGDVEAAARGEA